MYGDYEAVYDFDANFIEGDMPRKQRKLIEAWTVLHPDELKAAWKSWNENGEMIKIEGRR
jgi:hypothetical protein